MAEDSMVGTKVLFENERVRVWDFKLAPGESTKIHTHRTDHLYVYLTDDNHLKVTDSGVDDFEVHQPEGHVAYWEVDEVPAPRFTHKATNVGQNNHRQIVIEFKRPRMALKS